MDPLGYSFCIITDGRRPEKLMSQLETIRSLHMPAYEILVGGRLPPGLAELRGHGPLCPVDLHFLADQGRLGDLRNELCNMAVMDRLIVTDDDMLFCHDFYKGLRKFGEGYEVMCTRLLNPDGSRFWDWATHGGPAGHRLLQYNETDAHLYITGGRVVMKSAVFQLVQWDPDIRFGQAEDVDFTRRLQAAGVRISMNPYSTIIHDDQEYTQVGLSVIKR